MEEMCLSWELKGTEREGVLWWICRGDKLTSDSSSFTSQLKTDGVSPGTRVLDGWHEATYPLFLTPGNHMLCEFHTRILPASHCEVKCWVFFNKHINGLGINMSDHFFPIYMTCYATVTVQASFATPCAGKTTYLNQEWRFQKMTE